MEKFVNKTIVIGIVVLFSISSGINVIGSNLIKKTNNWGIEKSDFSDIKYLELDFSFSDPEIVAYKNYSIIRINETNHNRIVMFDLNPGKPVLPVNISVFNLEFGSKILDINYEHSPPITYDLPNKMIFCKATSDGIKTVNIGMDNSIYENDEPYPPDWIESHTGGGIIQKEHTTFFILRVYPVRYFPTEDNVQFIKTITVNISYVEPMKPLLEDTNRYDLLIVTPGEFKKQLQTLACHKNHNGVKTRISTVDEIYKTMYWQGRDKAEKIKYYIKTAIEKWGITHVLLAGGIKGQTLRWNIPVRYSYVDPTEEGETTEKSFLSDLYYADIYDSEGNFSSWDSDFDNKFSVWNKTLKDEMDLYPDVYLGRLPCRNKAELKIMIDKILNYEKTDKTNKDWFNNLLIVAGDSYEDSYGFIEGVLVSEQAKKLMPDFDYIEVYANQTNDINRKTVNTALRKGGGFAYFCGHGSIRTWSTHLAPDAEEWATGYNVEDMKYSRNKGKLPVTVVGGCHNGQFDVRLTNIIKGIFEDGLKYFQKKSPRGQWWSGEWSTNCWAWWFTSQKKGGSIATIANTGLGYHGSADQDNDSIADYIEILDGWLELRFLEIYGTEGRDILGENHADTITSYLQRFIGDGHKLDVKMVQQWELFGDPSLKIGGYKSNTNLNYS